MNKEAILKTIRQNKPEFRPLADQQGNSSKETIIDLKEVLRESLGQVGAELIELDGEDEVAAYIKTHHEDAFSFDDPKVFEVYSSNCPKSKLDKIGVAIIQGQFGVAENGAIWVDESNFPNRLIPFIAQQLIIKLNKGNLVKDMHEAYRRIKLEEIGFGLFISGPSKTADIEQSLVYGAHGAKKLIVIIY